MNQPSPRQLRPLKLLSVVIPARDEEGCIASTVEHLHLELRLHKVPHEIIVVDDGSTDRTAAIDDRARRNASPKRALSRNGPAHGFGRAISYGLRQMSGDAVVVMMADESDDCRDVVRYWKTAQRRLGCGFRFALHDRAAASSIIRGSSCASIAWPIFFIRILFRISLNDTTNAFKAYRATVIEGCEPMLSAHFNLTVEIPLKTIIRGYSWTDIPITWRNRRTGVAKLKIQEMGSRYLFICLYLWLEKYLSRGDYRRKA